MALTPIALELDEAQEETLRRDVREQLSQALEVHVQREERFALFRRAYKALPKQETKDFPWPNASNIVIPIVAATIDSIVARLQKAVIGSKDFAEVEIKAPAWEPLEKDLREWINHFVLVGGLKSRLRTIAQDMALCGDAYVKPTWVEEIRTGHMYNDSGEVVMLPIPEYVGVKWLVPSPDDIIYPSGYDEWSQLPWKCNRLRYTKAELFRMSRLGLLDREAVLKIVERGGQERDDPKTLVTDAATKTSGPKAQLFTLYEIHGQFEIPAPSDVPQGEEQDPLYEEVILTYSLDADVFARKIYNPNFGKAHLIVKLPYLNQAHEVQGQGAAEQCIPFQEEASTAHNQMIDAATAANAGIVVVSTETNMGAEEEIYPGKKLVTPNPDKDVRILHLSEPGPAIANIEERAAYHAEKRSGMSSYNLGMESSVVGSRATATGTTALISEGNIRQWVSIDDMRDALAELIYLTIQMEQQYRPEGYEWAPGKRIQFPQGDVRSSLGLTIRVTSENVNRDLELQNLAALMNVLNDYYTRLSSAAMMMFNPQIPPQAKMTAFQIMMASQDIVRRFVERFDIENVALVVPNIAEILQGVMNGAPQGLPGAPTPGSAMGPGMVGGGAGPMPPGPPSGGNGAGATPPAGASALPV